MRFSSRLFRRDPVENSKGRGAPQPLRPPEQAHGRDAAAELHQAEPAADEKNRLSSDESLQGDALLVQLIGAYKTANWGTALSPQAEQDMAREFVRRHGTRAVDTAIRWLNECKPDNPGDSFFFADASNGTLISERTKGDHHDYEFLIRLLTEIGDERAAEPLLRHFRAQASYGSGIARSIADFLARLKCKKAAKGLAAYLGTSSDSMLSAAAYGLGLLEADGTRDALRDALDRHGQCVKDGLQQADTNFAKSLIREWDAKRRAAGPPIESMTDPQMIRILGALCTAYHTNNPQDIRRLEPTAIDIAEELSRRGGEEEMLRVFGLLGGMPGSRSLEIHWHGIGGWLA